MSARAKTYLELVLEAEIAGAEAQRDGDAQRHEGQLPAEDEGDDKGADDLEERRVDHGHVYAEQLLQLLGVAGHAGGQRAGRVLLVVEEDGLLVQDGLEVLLAVLGADVVLQGVDI